MKLKLPFFICTCLLLPAMARGQVVINEIQVANVDMFIDPSFNYGSWVELYNSSADTITLADMVLRHTGADGTLEEQRLTARHGTLMPKGFCVLWFDHNSKDGYYGKNAGMQIPFKMDADGGVVELTDATKNILDAVSYPPAVTRCSYARVKNGGKDWGYTSMPTPSRSNDTSIFAEERLQMPETNVKGRVFKEPFSLKVNIPAGTTLYYTILPMALLRYQEQVRYRIQESLR